MFNSYVTITTGYHSSPKNYQSSEAHVIFLHAKNDRKIEELSPISRFWLYCFPDFDIMRSHGAT